jgi:hypothetical protein
MRAGTRGAIFMLIGAIAAGCATPSTAPPSIVLRAADGAVWIGTEEIGRFRCERGLLTCDDPVGRLSQRRCRCLE